MSAMSVTVDLIEQRGSVADLHALDPFAGEPLARPQLWWCVAERPALVLGSRQQPDLVDADAAAAGGLDVVRRRSGGGAVLIRPDALVWLDLVFPHGLVPDDVRASMRFVGACWRDALVDLGAPSSAIEVHDGEMVCTPWSDLVCFAGLGPGEVLAGGRKLVGLSQRRTRHGIRVQGQVHRAPLLSLMPALFAVPVPDGAPDEPALLADVGLGTIGDRELAVALAAAVGRRTTAG